MARRLCPCQLSVRPLAAVADRRVAEAAGLPQSLPRPCPQSHRDRASHRRWDSLETRPLCPTGPPDARRIQPWRTSDRRPTRTHTDGRPRTPDGTAVTGPFGRQSHPSHRHRRISEKENSPPTQGCSAWCQYWCPSFSTGGFFLMRVRAFAVINPVWRARGRFKVNSVCLVLFELISSPAFACICSAPEV